MLRPVLEHLLTRQAGVVSLAQAVAYGMSRSTVHRRVREGAWLLLHPGVYLVGGHRLTDEARVRAAWLWAGGGPAAVTGPAAAFWHGMLDRAPEVVELTVPRQRRLRPRQGTAVRRRDLSSTDLVGVRDLWLAARPFAALETAVALPDGSRFLDRELQRYVRFPTLYRSYCRNLGRAGSAEAARLIGAAADRADSDAERKLVRILRDGGITGWVLGHPFGPFLVDLAFPALRIAVEVDGWARHVDAVRFAQDRRKGNALTRAGWDLLRFTWHQLDGTPQEVLAEVVETRALAAARPA